MSSILSLVYKIKLFHANKKQNDNFTFWLRSLAGTEVLLEWWGEMEEGTEGTVGEDGGKEKNASRGDRALGVLRCFPIMDTPMAGCQRMS